MKRTITLLLVVCLIFSISCVCASASTEKNLDKDIAYGVCYTYDTSASYGFIFSDEEIIEILCKANSYMLEDVNRDPVTLSDLLTSQEILAFTERGVDPSEIELSIFETEVTSEPQGEPTKGPDTVSYTKSINYTVNNILGSTKLKFTVTWNVNKPTGAITIISKHITHRSGPVGNYLSWGVTNPISNWHTFSNGTIDRTYVVDFRVTTGGSLVKI